MGCTLMKNRIRIVFNIGKKYQENRSIVRDLINSANSDWNGSAKNEGVFKVIVHFNADMDIHDCRPSREG